MSLHIGSITDEKLNGKTGFQSSFIHFKLFYLTLLSPRVADRNLESTYIFLKVFHTEFIGFEEELCPVHAAGVQDDICALRYPVAVYDVIRQGFTHGEIHHRVEAQAFLDEALQHLQLLKVPVLERSLTCSQAMAFTKSSLA